MPHPISIDNEEDFVRQWSGRAYDHSQLAAIAELEAHMIDYAMNAWRPMDIEPPRNVLLMTAVDEGLALMLKTDMGVWRTNAGQPHKAPRAWMPAPKLPK